MNGINEVALSMNECMKGEREEITLHYVIEHKDILMNRNSLYCTLWRESERKNQFNTVVRER